MNPVFETNPAWSNTSEYASIDADTFKADMAAVKKTTEWIQNETRKIQSSLTALTATPDVIKGLQTLLIEKEKAGVLISNLFVFTRCETSVDATNKPAKARLSELQKLSTENTEAFNSASLFLMRCEEPVFQAIMEHGELRASRFEWSEKRKLKPTLLSEAEEALTTTLSQSGFSAWGDLYEAVSGNMTVTIERDGKSETMGLAQAHSLTRSSVEADRKAAWNGIQNAWGVHQETAAGILNAIAGWRLDLNKKRSHTVPVHFLNQPCFDSRIEKKTLDAMMTAIENNIEDIRKGGLTMAGLLGKKQLDPWDLLSPSPIRANATAASFTEGLNQIKESFHNVDPELSEFVTMMNEKKWIEARVMPNKITGAYCTGFAKSKTPRVYMTYMGSSNDISTLAHELGHAYHSWVMRDLPLAEQEYPMTLAETASIFAETLLNETLIEKATTREEKLEFAWNSASNAMSLLLNIPARYTFEKSFYEKREERALSVDEFKQLMEQSWTKWYGPVLSKNDPLFWAHKLHFAITGVSFYNFPYAFGYLFSLSIYARRKTLGKDFMPKYRALLMDTGRMSAEDLVQKHLGEDIRNPQFWQSSIDVVKEQIQLFTDLTKAN